MQNKTLAILGVIAVIAMVALVVIGMMPVDNDSQEEAKDGVTYHGNGGTSNGSDSFHSSDYEAAPYFFTKDGMTTYAWNTKADATGDFYKTGDAIDQDIHDLYAVWAYSFNAAVNGTTVNQQSITPVLVNIDSYIGSQGVMSSFLDGSNDKARLGFAASDKTVEWVANEDNTVFTAVGEKYTFTVSLKDIVGMENITFVDSADGMFAVDFNYSGNVSLTITDSVALNKTA